LIAIVGASHAEVQAFLHEHAEHGEGGQGGDAPASASLATFAVIVLSLGAIGWAIEAAVTGAVIRFISRVKPDLLAHVLHASRAGRGA
jgi:ABC-type Co2+ transport system permease subunit